MDLREERPSDRHAVRDGQVVGHVMFTRSLLDAARRLVEVQVLSPLGVLPEFHRRGAGSDLVVRFPAHEPWMTGTLVYAEPFWRHDSVGLRIVTSAGAEPRK